MSLSIGQSLFRREIQLLQDSLRELSDETGGFAVVNKNDFSTAYDRIVKDNSAYYVLAYYPPNPKRDGRFHRIEVRVTRPGLMVTRSRRGYVNPRGKAPVPTATSASGQPSAELRDAEPAAGKRRHAARLRGAVRGERRPTRRCWSAPKSGAISNWTRTTGWKSLLGGGDAKGSFGAAARTR
jgi:hypothetical protein